MSKTADLKQLPSDVKCDTQENKKKKLPKWRVMSNQDKKIAKVKALRKHYFKSSVFKHIAFVHAANNKSFEEVLNDDGFNDYLHSIRPENKRIFTVQQNLIYMTGIVSALITFDGKYVDCYGTASPEMQLSDALLVYLINEVDIWPS